MTLDDFERQLARDKEEEKRHERHRDSSKSEHRHRHRSSRHDDSRENEDGHRSKRRRYSNDDDRDDRRHKHKHRHRRDSKDEDKEDAKEAPTLRRPENGDLKRDSWMVAPSAIEIDYVQRKQKQQSPPKAGSLGANFELKLHEKELNHHLRDLQDGKERDDIENESPKHEVDYTFGDSGSQWRMTKLKAVYRKAEEKGQKAEDVALERYDSLRDFDDAREEEIELDRRKTYGEGYVGKEKPSGELFQDRKLDAGVHQPPKDDEDDAFDQVLDNVKAPAPATTAPKMDQTSLNKLKAQLMKAQLRKDPKAAELETQYNEALAASSATDPTTVSLSAMDNRMLSSAPRNEVKAVQNRRGAERGNVEENEDMSIEDMVREERRTRGQGGGEGYRAAERIAKDGKFDNDLDYMDENATKLAQRVHKSEGNLRNVAISEYQKMNKILETCPLCHHEDTETPPIAPVVSLGTRAYLTLPTEPELTPLGAIIVPIQHRTNLLGCDDDEWEEIRNFMKSLTRLYHDQGRDVVFYENAAHPHRKPHAGMTVVPLPYSLGETAPAFFKEAFLTTEDEWESTSENHRYTSEEQAGFGQASIQKEPCQGDAVLPCVVRARWRDWSCC